MAGKNKKLTRGASAKSYFAGYNYTANKIKRLEKQVSAQPNNKQAKAALKAAKAELQVKRRPLNKGGWVNKSNYPFNGLSDKNQRLPMDDAGSEDVLSENSVVMAYTLAQKTRYAQFAKQKRKFENVASFQEKHHQKGPAKKKSGYAEAEAAKLRMGMGK